MTPTQELVLRALEAAREDRQPEAFALLEEAAANGGLDDAFLKGPRVGGFHRQVLGWAAPNLYNRGGQSSGHFTAATTSLAAKLGAIPAMTVRVGDRGYSRSYEGVSVRTVAISAACPNCGGPRGEKRSGRIIEDGEYYWVDDWDNQCGHEDMYASVLVEAGWHPWPKAAK